MGFPALDGSEKYINSFQPDAKNKIQKLNRCQWI